MVNFKEKILKNWQLLLIFCLSLFISWPLFKSGYFSHQDDLQIIRLFEMRKCFSDFQIPCRWVSNMGWGNGFPLFNYYGVFTYYVGGILSYIFGYIITSKILFYVSLTFGSFGIYLLVSKILNKNAALVSSILYMFAPYKALDVYVRGALSEAMALAIIPFVLYYFYKLVKDPRNLFNVFLSSLFLSIFLTTHNIMTVLFFPLVIIWIIYWLIVEKRFKDIKLLFIAIILGLGLSSFFILPAFLEKNLVQEESLTRFELDYRANFVGIRQLFFDRTWGFGTSIPGPEGGMSFQIGWPYWFLVIVSFPVVLFFSKIKIRKKILFLGLVLLFTFSIFMTHNKSTFIWEKIEILKYFQFPWRFLSLSIFSSSLICGFFIYAFKNKKLQIFFMFVLIVLTLILNWGYFKPKELYKISDAEKLSGVNWENQRRGAILDYLPKTALEPREAASNMPLVLTKEAIIESFYIKSNYWSFNIVTNEPSEIEIPVFYFPNWEVFVNNEKHDFSYDNLMGRIRINLEKGDFLVEGRFKNTPIRSFSNILTLVSAFSLGYILWKKLKR